MNKFLKLNVIAAVFSTYGFATEYALNMENSLEFNGQDVSADVNLGHGAQAAVNEDFTYSGMMTMAQSSVLDVKDGKTMTLDGVLNINPADPNTLQKTMTKGSKLFYEYEDGDGNLVYAMVQNAIPGTDGFYDADGNILQSQPENVSASYFETVTGAPTGTGTIHMGFGTIQKRETITGNCNLNLSSTTTQLNLPNYCAYSGTFAGNNGLGKPFSLENVVFWAPRGNATLSNAEISQNSLEGLADSAEDIYIFNCYVGSLFSPTGEDNITLAYYYSQPFTNLTITNVNPVMVDGVTGKIVGGSATLASAGSAILARDDTDLSGTALSGVAPGNKRALSQASTEAGWQESWLNSLPTIKYTDKSSTTQTFFKGEDAANQDNISLGDESVGVYLNSFGLYPDSVNDVRDETKTAIELLTDLAVSNYAIKIPTGTELDLEGADRTISASLHNSSISEATVSVKDSNFVLTLAGNNNELKGTITFNSAVGFSGENSVPGGTVTFNKAVTFNADTKVEGDIVFKGAVDVRANPSFYGTVKFG